MKTFETQNENSFQEIERLLRQAGSNFPYPPQPDILQAVLTRTTRSRRSPVLRPLVVGLAVVGLLCVGLLLVPPARAAFVRIIRIGVIQVFLEPTPIPITPEDQETLDPSPPSQASLLELAGRTTLAEAQARVGFDIHLPGYPPGLGDPDQVFVQDQGGPVVLLVWLDPEEPGRIQLSLMILGPGVLMGKSAPQVLVHTVVGEDKALWMEGNHVLYMDTAEGGGLIQLSVRGNVLVWERGDLTYRLESDFQLPVARQVAESLP